MRTGERHLIIAGSNKCGTTSLFRYIGAHPSVCISQTKEARFFYRDRHLDPTSLRANYRQLFPYTDVTASLLVEASPTYLHGGRDVAVQIKRVVPDARLLFLLRDPAARFVSYYKSKFGQIDSHVGMKDFSSFSKMALAACDKDVADLEPHESAFRQELSMARYAEFLPTFLDVFGSNNVGIFFFDDMLADTRKFMYSVCDFCALSKDPFRRYEFTVENKTRLHRNSKIREAATRLNEQFEYMLNRLPGVRRTLRGVYDIINAKPNSKISVDPASYNEIQSFYQEPNRRLRELLITYYPGMTLPTWLEERE